MCFVDDCAPAMIMARGLMCSSDFVSRFMGQGSWVCIRGSLTCSGWWVLAGVEIGVVGFGWG